MCKLSLTFTRKQIFFPSKHLTKWTDQVSTRAPLTNTMLYISDFYCIPNLIFISSFTGGPDRDTIIFCFIELNKTRATERLFYSITAASQTFWFRKALRCFGVNHSLLPWAGTGCRKVLAKWSRILLEGMEMRVSFQKFCFICSTTAS